MGCYQPINQIFSPVYEKNCLVPRKCLRRTLLLIIRKTLRLQRFSKNVAEFFKVVIFHSTSGKLFRWLQKKKNSDQNKFLRNKEFFVIAFQECSYKLEAYHESAKHLGWSPSAKTRNRF